MNMDYKDIISLISKALTPSQTIEVNQYILNLEKQCTDISKQYAELNKENAQLTLKVMELNTQIANYDRWEQDKEKYEIVKISSSTFVYKLKGTPQVFCPKCFNDNRVPVHLRPPVINPSGRVECPKCKSVYNDDRGER